MQVKNNICEYL